MPRQQGHGCDGAAARPPEGTRESTSEGARPHVSDRSFLSALYTRMSDLRTGAPRNFFCSVGSKISPNEIMPCSLRAMLAKTAYPAVSFDGKKPTTRGGFSSSACCVDLHVFVAAVHGRIRGRTRRRHASSQALSRHHRHGWSQARMSHGRRHASCGGRAHHESMYRNRSTCFTFLSSSTESREISRSMASTMPALVGSAS